MASKTVKWTLIGTFLFLLFSSILFYALGLSWKFLLWYNFAVILAVVLILLILWIMDRNNKITAHPDDIVNKTKINVDENEIRREIFEHMFLTESISYRKDNNDIVYSMNEDYFIGIMPVQLQDGTFQQIFGWHFRSKDHGKYYIFRMNVHDYNSKYYEVVNGKITHEKFMEFCKEGAKGLYDEQVYTRTHEDEMSGRTITEHSPTPFQQTHAPRPQSQQLSISVDQKKPVEQMTTDELKALIKAKEKKR